MAKKVPIVQATFYNNNTKHIENCYPMTSAKGVVMSDGKTLEESFSDKADNSVVVHKSGDEEILGRKTFDVLRANEFSLSDYGDWNRWVNAFYSFLENKGIIQFGTENDWSVILRNIADPEYENDAATKGYVDTKISSTEETLVHKDGYERITERKQFLKGISVGLFNSLVANEDGVQSGAWLDQAENPAPFIVADPSADDHAATKLYVDKGLATKQNTLTPGNGISIVGDVIGVTAITESESQPDTSLWLNPSEDEETDVTYNRSQIDAMVGAKQDALQLTVKDNGNIVLSNIQGQSKEFMPATPSGDPMHYAYEAAGAEWNGTGADIVKTTPWAKVADDDADKVVVHKAGCWYLNGLGDLTNADMKNIYTYGIITTHEMQNRLASMKIKTCISVIKYYYTVSSFNAFAYASSVIVLDFSTNIQVDTLSRAFYNCQKLKYVGGINCSYTDQSSTSAFYNNTQLKFLMIKGLKLSILLSESRLLTIHSILFLINNEVSKSAITITLHPDAYTRAMANADIIAALEAHPNVSLASA